MDVFVIGLNGNPLMPMKPQKARKLLDAGKAVVFRKRPFTIKLLYKTGATVQPITIGVDTGSQHIGIAVVANNKVLYKADITYAIRWKNALSWKQEKLIAKADGIVKSDIANQNTSSEPKELIQKNL